MTGAIWMRGLLSDEYGVQPDEIGWRTGGLNRPRIPALTAASLPPSLQVEEISPHDTLSEQLRRGDLDGILTPDVPDSFREKVPYVGRLFSNYRVAEQDYARRTGLHPIMHLLALRRRVLEEQPKLATHLMQALTEARDLALADLSELSAVHTTLPWTASYAAEVSDVLGYKLWPYGIEANREEIETLIRYAFEQQLILRPLRTDELFQ
jgi:4,5-dihydroxyphthalate decarboxylase